VYSFHESVENMCSIWTTLGQGREVGEKKERKTQRVSYRHTFRMSFLQSQSTRRQFSRTTVSCGEEET